MAKRTMHGTDIRTRVSTVDISVRSDSFSFRYRSAFIVRATPTHNAHPQRRTVRLDRLLASWRSFFNEGCHFFRVEWLSTLSCTLEPQWTALREFTRPLSQKCASSVNQRRSGTAGCPANHCVIFTRLLLSSGCQLLTNLYPVGMDGDVFVQDRVQ